jgi:hypothetical protein
MEGTYQQSKITADGDLNDWELPLRFQSVIGGMQYAVTNDNDNIYVSLHTSDDGTQNKILKAGVDIYIDPTGGDDKTMDISFPLKGSANQANEFPQNSTSKDRKDNVKTKQEMVMLSNTFNVSGFTTMENRLYDIKDSSNIRVALKIDDAGNMGYEAIIPIKDVLGIPMTATEAGQKITVGVVINALPQNHKSGQGIGLNGMRIGTGRHSGMGNGGNHNTNLNDENAGPDRAAQYKEDANWYMFKLAYKKA